jgi:hypothetical protein
VILQIDQYGLLEWDLPSGAVMRLTEGVAGAVSVAPSGCDWTITIGGITASCTT